MEYVDLSNLGYRELDEAIDLLKAHKAGKYTDVAEDYFDTDGLQIGFNPNSGYVFLTNGDYQAVMINPDNGKLDLWINTSWTGQEGYLKDLIAEADEDWEEDDLRDLEQYKEYLSAAEKKKLEKLLRE